MDKETALIIQLHALAAIKEIHKIVEKRTKSELGEVFRGVGSVLGTIECEVLGPIYAIYPEMDDLARS
jgi:hypothetical protein